MPLLTTLASCAAGVRCIFDGDGPVNVLPFAGLVLLALIVLGVWINRRGGAS
jgi:hypothetical protein